MSRKIHIDTKTSSLPMQPMKETNGAVTTNESVANLVSKGGKASSSQLSALRGEAATLHQTHGAVLPSDARITSVDQLIGRTRHTAKGAIGSFDTIEEYHGYLNTLTLHELHRHAVEEAKIVPIDDRNRLIRRLESEYTAIAARIPGRKANIIPQPKSYSQEQNDKMEELKRKMLRR
jgi:hypothetical protein